MALTQLEENAAEYWRAMARSNAAQAEVEHGLVVHWHEKYKVARRSNQKLAIAAAVFAFLAVVAGVALWVVGPA